MIRCPQTVGHVIYCTFSIIIRSITNSLLNELHWKTVFNSIKVVFLAQIYIAIFITFPPPFFFCSDAVLQCHTAECDCACAAAVLSCLSASRVKMAKSNLMFTQCVLYFLAFVFGFIAVVPLSENAEDFGGKCLLFTRGMWQNENITVSKQRFMVEEWGPQSSCSFITFVGVASLALAAVQAWRLLFLICKGHDE